MYNFALFVHLVGVAILFVTVGIELSSTFKALQATSASELRAATTSAPYVTRLIPVAIVLIVAPGLYMVSRSTEFSWGASWLKVAFVLVGILLVVGPAVNGRRLEALTEAAVAAPDGPLSPDLRAKVLDPVMHLGMRGATSLTVVLLYLMTNKPDLAAGTAAAVAGAIVGVATTVPVLRRAAVELPAVGLGGVAAGR